MNRKLTRPVLSLSLTGSLVASLLVAPAALADTRPPATAGGEVLAVANTPNLYVTDSSGRVRLAADPAALVGHDVAWTTPRQISVEELRTYDIAGPFTSMALVRIGTDIFLPRTQAAGAPVLRQIRSLDDLALIGVTAANYGQLVLEQGAWETRYGFRVGDLSFEDFSLDGRPRVTLGGAPVASSESSSPSEAASVAPPSVPGILMPGSIVEASVDPAAPTA